MSAIYASFAIAPKDDIQARQAKLYLGVISLGETLYQKGAAVAEMNKEFLAIEKEIAAMRLELKGIRETMEGR